MRMRSILKDALLRSLSLAGITELAGLYRRRRMLVACYHGVVSRDCPPDSRAGYENTVSAREFEFQLETFARWFQFVDLAGAARWLADGPPAGKPPLLITFDDGYRNNLTLAAPILRKFGVPAAFFLTANYIGDTRVLWPIELLLRIQNSPGREIPLPGSGPAAIPQDSDRRHALGRRIRGATKRMPNAERLAYLDCLRASTDLDADRIDREMNDFLSWKEARELAGMGFDIGSHTLEHPILSRLSASELAGELAGSRTRLEAEIGRPVTALAYPNGGPDDYNAAVVDEARQAGYRLAFAVGDSFHDRAGSPMEIRRMIIPGHLPADVFRFIASGCRDLLRRR